MKALIFLLLFGWSCAFAQTPVPTQPAKGKDAIYLELLGSALLVSLNYERLFYTAGPLTYAGRVGLGTYPSAGWLGPGKFKGIVPVTFSLLYGRQLSLETGIGASVGWRAAEDDFGSHGYIKWFNGILGVRYQHPGGPFLRIGFTPYMGIKSICLDDYCRKTGTRLEAAPFHFGLSFGRRFPKVK